MFSLKIIITVLLSSDLDRKIKANEQWESDYDEHTSSVTKRKYFH